MWSPGGTGASDPISRKAKWEAMPAPAPADRPAYFCMNLVFHDVHQEVRARLQDEEQHERARLEPIQKPRMIVRWIGTMRA